MYFENKWLLQFLSSGIGNALYRACTVWELWWKPLLRCHEHLCSAHFLSGWWRWSDDLSQGWNLVRCGSGILSLLMCAPSWSLHQNFLLSGLDRSQHQLNWSQLINPYICLCYNSCFPSKNCCVSFLRSTQNLHMSAKKNWISVKWIRKIFKLDFF